MVLISLKEIVSMMSIASLVTLSMYWQTCAHWKKWPLCIPDRSMKCPLNRAFVSSKIEITSESISFMDHHTFSEMKIGNTNHPIIYFKRKFYPTRTTRDRVVMFVQLLSQPILISGPRDRSSFETERSLELSASMALSISSWAFLSEADKVA